MMQHKAHTEGLETSGGHRRRESRVKPKPSRHLMYSGTLLYRLSLMLVDSSLTSWWGTFTQRAYIQYDCLLVHVCTVSNLKERQTKGSKNESCHQD